MVLESLIGIKKIEKHFSFVFFLSFLYVFISYGVSYLFFGKAVSIVTIFTLSLLLIPSLQKIIFAEEKIEAKYGSKHFFRNNKLVFIAYFAAFLGILVGYLILGAVTDYNNSFYYQKTYLEKSEGIDREVIEGYVAYPIEPSVESYLALFSQNVSVLVICFVLSVFYGAGSVFLIILNGSIAASFMIYVFRVLIYTTYQKSVLAGIFMIHMIPEIAGFILAAIAGALLSQALITERYHTKRFRNVTRNIFILFAFGLLLLILSAFLELVVSQRLVYMFL